MPIPSSRHSHLLALGAAFAAVLAGVHLVAGGAERAPSRATQACVTPGSWTSLDGGTPRTVAPSAVLDAMARRDVVLLGENHDDADHHRWQLQVLAALHALRPDMVIGFEMFPRRVQPALDRWVAGELTQAEFLKQSDWDAVWTLPAELYLPLFQFARINRIPMVALNVDRKLTRAVAEKGWGGVPEAEREGVGRAAKPAPAYRDLLRESWRAHAETGNARGADAAKGSGGSTDARDARVGAGDPGRTAGGATADRRFENFVESQTTWDRAMAEAIAHRLVVTAAGGKPLVVGVMGSGHIRDGHGVPHQLADLGVESVGALLPVGHDVDCAELHEGVADAVFAVPGQVAAPPPPPRLGVRLEDRDGGVRIVDVTAGSLAERSGLIGGDVVLEAAGRPMKSSMALISIVRQAPAGTWMPMRVKRGAEAVEVMVKFPVPQP